MSTSNVKRDLDGIDARLLLALIDEPDATTVALAQRLGVSRNTVQSRLQKLSTHTLESFQRRISPRSMCSEVEAFMNASIRQGYDYQPKTAFSEMQEQQEIIITTGDADLSITVTALSTYDLYRVNRLILDIPGIVRTSTSVVLREFLSYRTKPLLRRIIEQ